MNWLFSLNYVVCEHGYKELESGRLDYIVTSLKQILELFILY